VSATRPTAAPCPAADLTIDLLVSPAFNAPRRVSPPGAQWSNTQSLLRWATGEVYAGLSGTAVAAFKVEAGVEAARVGLAASYAVVRLRGVAGERGGRFGWGAWLCLQGLCMKGLKGPASQSSW